MKLKAWLDTIAFQLQDDEPDREYERYPVKQLLAAYNAAMVLVARYRPDLFTEYEIVKLQPGRYQDTRGCGCTNVLDVVDQTDAKGGTITEIKGARKTKTVAKRHWNKPSCLNSPTGDKGYKVDNISIDENMNGRFTVKPPVPCDVDAYVRVKCVKQPCPLEEADLNTSFDGNSEMNTAAWHFVLARMKSGDRDSHNATGDVKFHMDMFFQILKINLEIETLFESPEKASR